MAQFAQSRRVIRRLHRAVPRPCCRKSVSALTAIDFHLGDSRQVLRKRGHCSSRQKMCEKFLSTIVQLTEVDFFVNSSLVRWVTTEEILGAITRAKTSSLSSGWARDIAFTLGRLGTDTSRARLGSGVRLSTARIPLCVIWHHSGSSETLGVRKLFAS